MEEGFMSILGVLIGGMIGFGASYVTLRLQWRKERRAIALGFKKELQHNRYWLASMAEGYRNAGPDFLREISQRPINTENSLYYIFRKEMFYLKSETIDELLTYYSYLFYAEEGRKGIRNSYPGANIQAAKNIEAALSMIDDLVRRLEKEGTYKTDDFLT